MKRRRFLSQSARCSLGFLGLQTFALGCASEASSSGQLTEIDKSILQPGYGPLQSDPQGILDLPEGFQYKIISRRGDQMSDGFLVPGSPDGMATFPAAFDKVLIVRNHEVSPGDRAGGPFGEDYALLGGVTPQQLYDYGRGILPCLGGTTTILYDPATGTVEQEYLSLAGTIRNCAGGATPWNSWITCEENVSNANNQLEKNHGYNFEVPAQVQPQLFDPVPLREMGRFNHEAVCVCPKTSIVYQSEDRHDSLIYRYLPNVRGRLHEGGKLQILAIKGQPGFDTRNWKDKTDMQMEIGKKYEVEWLDIDGIDSEEDDLRLRGYEKGAARFARGEGMWYGENEFYVACTNGGALEHGQIFRYIPSPAEGTSRELDQPPTIEIFVEPNNIDLLKSCDNLTISRDGDLVICEDRSTPRIVGVTPEGGIYHIANNVGYPSEFAGATFSPDGSTLFVNIQGPGLTLAISGPWSRERLLG